MIAKAIYTDGSTKPSNPGPSGWAAFITDTEDHPAKFVHIDKLSQKTSDDGKIKSMAFAKTSERGSVMVYGRVGWSTNNAMELMAIYGALRYLPADPRLHLFIYTDSLNAVNWLGSMLKAEPVYRPQYNSPEFRANPLLKTLWVGIRKLSYKFGGIEICHVKGHKNDIENIRVDKEAGKQAEIARRLGYVA